MPATHPALLLAALGVAALLVALISFPITDPDLWQHLTVGRAIWQTHSIPQTHQWSWPTYGIREVLPSWAFRALLWPVYDSAGVNGLFAWRWITTLVTFALAWAAARRMGARGFSPLIAIALCGMVYRGRTMVRPETLVAPLLALAILCLVWRRQGGRVRLAGREWDPAWVLVPVTCLWANIHISYWIAFLLAGCALLDEWFGQAAAKRGAVRGTAGARAAVGASSAVRAGGGAFGGLVPIALVAALAAFLNPFGWRALWQPFEYFLYWRSEPIYKTIGELSPVDWGVNLKNGLPLLVVAWPLLALWRLARGRRDLLELGLVATMVPLTLSGQRFMGFLAIAAAPFLGRDLAELAGALSRRLGDARPWPRAALAVSLIALLAAPILGDLRHWFGVGLDLRRYPVAACDFLEREQVRGRVFNAFFHGGYLLWRFWPDQGRLPFMDIHQSGTRADRDGLAYASGDERAWQVLDGQRNFEVIVYPRYAENDMPFLDRRDADSAWALVFVDDAAAVYVRREPRFAPLIARHGYALLPGGAARMAAVQPAAAGDPMVRRALAGELERAIAESRASSRARYLLGGIAALEGRLDDAEREFRQALVADPVTRRVHEGIGAIAAARGDHATAVAEYLAEGRIGGWPRGVRTRLGASYAALGKWTDARRAYRAELAEDPGSAEARDSLAALESRGR